MNRSQYAMFLLAALLVTGSGLACDREPPAATSASTVATSRPTSGASDDAATQAKRTRIVFLGDSLTAGLGVDPEQTFPALIGKQLAEADIAVQVVNAGVSGDTTAGGLRRLDWLLRQRPDVLVVGLGANDGLRGIPPSASADNLRAIIRRAQDSGARVLLLGMMIPPNYGPEYAAEFRTIYPTLAGEFGVPLVPFLLEGVGGDARLNQPDGIHPTAEGHRVVANTVGGQLKRMLVP